MTNDRVKVSDYIAQRLVEKHGVSQIFMITGGGAMHLNDAFGKTPGLKYCCNHHEQACAIAAEGYARASGKLGVVNVTTGPGGTNTLTGVLGQWTDSVPVLYISGQIKQSNSLYHQPGLRLRQLGDQECDITRVVGPVTKMAETLRDPKDVKRLLDKAVHVATTGRPGPVWLDVPMDVQGATVALADLRDYDPAEDAAPDEPDSAAKVAQTWALLQKAQRPVLVAGHGIRIAKALPAFLKLVERLGVPVLGTFNGMDLLPTDDPCFIGRIGTLGSRAGNFALQNSDLCISIGSRNNTRQVSYNPEFFARAAKKVVVDIDGQELLKDTVKPDLGIRMDAGAFIEGLLALSEDAARPDASGWLDWCLERKRRYPILAASNAANPRMDPYVFADRLTRAMPADAVLVGGDGTASVAPFQAGQVRGSQRFIWNSGCASMGYDLPAAIGASLASGPVICLAGDGSAMMNLQELETIAHLKLPIKIFLLCNKGYISIRQTQNAYFEGRLTGVDPDSGVGLPDYRKLAQALGLATELIAEPGELDAKLAAVLAAPGPLLCEVRLPFDYAFEPKLSSAKLPDGRMVSKPLEDLSPLLSREEFQSNMLIPPLAD